MRFYYFSLFSWLAYAVVVFIALTLLWLVWTRFLKLKIANPVYWVLVATIVVLPWAEEIWIAYNFDRLCSKDAGVVIKNRVKVAGFYDDTTGWGPRQLAESQYQFMESRDVLSRKLLRVERTDDASRDRALAWYSERNPGKERSKDQFVVQSLTDKERIVVSANTLDAWRVTTIDKPTARYHFKSAWSGQATQVAHKIWREETSVVDTQTEQRIGQYAMYSRAPYWFYIGLGPAPYGCDGPDGGPNTKHSSLIYKQVLEPAS